MKHWVIIYFLLIPAAILSQTDEKIVLQGKITNTKDVEGIHIMNTSSRFNSVTDAYGNFAITVRVNDTLIFSSIHYAPEKIGIDEATFESGLLIVTLTELINELDEVLLGPDLTGNLKTDIEKIPVKDQINFDDVGIPGFKGTPEEKIPRMIGQVITPLSVNIEGLYKHLSGYYRKLRLQRKWEAENVAVARMLQLYPPKFFHDAFSIPEQRAYDFLLFCVETTQLSREFSKENYAVVLEIFESKAAIYAERLKEKKE